MLDECTTSSVSESANLEIYQCACENGNQGISFLAALEPDAWRHLHALKTGRHFARDDFCLKRQKVYWSTVNLKQYDRQWQIIALNNSAHAKIKAVAHKMA